jgi:Bacterial regulatory protein, Fis family
MPKGGPATEDADLLFASLPYNLLAQIHVGLTAKLKELDADLLAGLEKVGFKLDYGDNGSGLFMKVLRKNGGYYIDVGASGLIASGEIAVAQGAGIAAFDREGVLVEDGRHVPADLVVLATGYEPMSAATRRILGDVEADRSDKSWGLDDEGEIRGLWRPSGHPGLWYMGGNLHLARYHSRALDELTWDHESAWQAVQAIPPGARRVTLPHGTVVRAWPVTGGTLADGAVLELDGDALATTDQPIALSPSPLPDGDDRLSPLERAERDVIREALASHAGNKSRAAAELRISRRSLYDKIRRYRLRA